LLFSFSVIPEIFKQESMLFFSLILKERNTSWIPAIDLNDKKNRGNDRESVRSGKGSMELAREEKLDLSSENNLSKIYLVKRLNC